MLQTLDAGLKKFKLVIIIFFGLMVLVMATAAGLLLASQTEKPALSGPTPTLAASLILTTTPTPTLTDTPRVTISATPSATPVLGISSTPSTTSPSSRTTGPKVTPTPYPIHQNILTTFFWAGEQGSSDNRGISNVPSAWDDNWSQHFGGVDDPKHRNGFMPQAFTPQENPFYFALPYGDYDNKGPKSNTTRIYWYSSFANGSSLLKNRWIKVIYQGKAAYAQWEDVGPYEEDDVDYVFGSAKPKQKVGLDVSPAVRDYLRLGDETITSWQFIDQSQVPTGPWSQIITTSGPDWK